MAVVGLDGIVVAVGSEGILVAPLSRAQEVREVAVEMRRRAAGRPGRVVEEKADGWEARGPEHSGHMTCAGVSPTS